MVTGSIYVIKYRCSRKSRKSGFLSSWVHLQAGLYTYFLYKSINRGGRRPTITGGLGGGAPQQAPSHDAEAWAAQKKKHPKKSTNIELLSGIGPYPMKWAEHWSTLSKTLAEDLFQGFLGPKSLEKK